MILSWLNFFSSYVTNLFLLRKQVKIGMDLFFYTELNEMHFFNQIFSTIFNIAKGVEI